LVFIDVYGNVKDLAWAESMFGVQEIYNPGVYPMWKIVRLEEAQGDNLQLVVAV